MGNVNKLIKINKTWQYLKTADKGTRTLDLRITNAPLYQLSYIGM